MSSIPEQHIPKSTSAKLISALAVLLGFCVLPSYAAQQNSASFSVGINLYTGNAPSNNTGLCRTASGIGAFGTTLTVVCATGSLAGFSSDASSLPWATMQPGTYRFVTQVSSAGEFLGTVDSYFGAGTVTSWRVISLSNRDYLEMMVHW